MFNKAVRELIFVYDIFLIVFLSPVYLVRLCLHLNLKHL